MMKEMISQVNDTNMANSTTTAHGEELPQHLQKAIHKLVHAGASHKAISITVGLKLEVDSKS
jgi:hypothetical protein